MPSHCQCDAWTPKRSATIPSLRLVTPWDGVIWFSLPARGVVNSLGARKSIRKRSKVPRLKFCDRRCGLRGGFKFQWAHGTEVYYGVGEGNASLPARREYFRSPGRREMCAKLTLSLAMQATTNPVVLAIKLLVRCLPRQGELSVHRISQARDASGREGRQVLERMCAPPLAQCTTAFCAGPSPTHLEEACWTRVQEPQLNQLHLASTNSLVHICQRLSVVCRALSDENRRIHPGCSQPRQDGRQNSRRCVGNPPRGGPQGPY